MWGPGFSEFGGGPRRGGFCHRFGPRHLNQDFFGPFRHHDFGHHPFGNHGHEEYRHHPMRHMFGGHHRHHPFSHRGFGRHGMGCPFIFPDLDADVDTRRQCRENRRCCHCNPTDSCDNRETYTAKRACCQCKKKDKVREGHNVTDVEDEEREERFPSHFDRIFSRRGGRCRRTRGDCFRRCGPSRNEDTQDVPRRVQVQRIIVEHEPRANSA